MKKLLLIDPGVMALAEVLKKNCSEVSVYLAVSYHFRLMLNGRISTDDNSDNEHILHIL